MNRQELISTITTKFGSNERIQLKSYVIRTVDGDIKVIPNTFEYNEKLEDLSTIDLRDVLFELEQAKIDHD